VTAPLARRKQNAVLRMYFDGLSYDQIARHAGVGKGSVEEIIRRLKSGEYEEFQDIHDQVETLRDTAVMIRKKFSGDIERAHVGSVAWAALNRLGVDPAKVPEWARMCEDLASSDVPAAKFVDIAMWSWRLQKDLGIPLLELPQRLEVLTEKVNSSLAERQALESQAQATKASVASLSVELKLLEDIRSLQSARKEEESRLVEARSQTRAALAAAEITSKGLEQFRVLAGTVKAKGVPLDGALFDTLLGLVGSLGPQGIQEVETLRNLLAEEGMSAGDSAALLTGLWGLGFTLSRAAKVARALGNAGPLPDVLARLVSALDEHGTLQAAVGAARQRRDELSKQVTAKVGEFKAVEQVLGPWRSELSNLQGQAKAAGEARDRIRAEIQKVAADREVERMRHVTEIRRLESMRGAWFDEYADRLTPDDWVQLGISISRKSSLEQIPPSAQWVWGLMTGQALRLISPRLGADGTPMRGPDGALVEETSIVTLSREERLRVREILQRASLDGEGPLRALGRIMSGRPEAPPKETNGLALEDPDLQVESMQRSQARRDLRDFVENIADGKVGRFDVLS